MKVSFVSSLVGFFEGVSRGMGNWLLDTSKTLDKLRDSLDKQ